MVGSNSRWSIRRAALWATAFAASGVLGDDVLVTSGFTNCNNDSDIKVQKADIKYDNAQKVVEFNVAGSSAKEQNVTAILSVTAYGRDVYTNKFNPCDAATRVDQLCPVPKGSFSAKGTQNITAQYANAIPAIAFQIPDIAALAKLQLQALDGDTDLGCFESQVTNGKTADVPAVPYVAAGIAGAALLLSGIGAIGSTLSGAGAASGAGGAGTISPSFGEVFGVFQGFAMNGMMSANLPQVYRSFSKNFAFSTGLIPFTQMQVTIDNFRASTGGNLTKDSVETLQNTTLVFPDGSTSSTNSSTVVKRAFDSFVTLALRDVDATVNATSGDDASSAETTIRTAVSGAQAYFEQLSVPQSNTFMTVLLIVAIVIAVIVVGILLVKVILEAWALFGSFPQSLTGFRKHYWGSIARAITSLILLLYGIWVLYCIFQFTHGDSWAAQLLAGVTLALFTGVLAFFSWKIWSMARKLKNAEGDPSGLYEDKSIWVKYSLFYESYKKDYWWLFVPAIVYMFAKGTVLAATDGKGMMQTIALLVVEGLMLSLLVWSRPYERKSGNVINILIQTVRLLSMVCILVFVEELGISQTTQTVTGVVLIALQSALAGLLGILIAWNAIVACCKQNPHRKRRKEMEKMQRDMDTLTPLDARNSLLMMERTKSNESTFSMAKINTNVNAKEQPFSSTTARRDSSEDRYLGAEPVNPYSTLSAASSYNRPLTPIVVDQSRQGLISGAAPINHQQPTLPHMGGGFGGGYGQGQGGYAPYRAPDTTNTTNEPIIGIGINVEVTISITYMTPPLRGPASSPSGESSDTTGDTPATHLRIHVFYLSIDIFHIYLP
ncbi:Uu.00g019760.m01.CDS01 [Anthostomella pinea]|uniref:Uu.00g019760.m01.CDS01 n=1 Tax=Anthostomella pinea TaxID=933095 RepID=A0AAI8VZC5_9PEZI|nr:Uu.00g019760.m01.CDS01 [Anthostomella pinea]